MSDDSPLRSVIADEQELNEELLADTVTTYARVGDETGSLIPEESFNELDAKGKIVVALLAQKVRYELDLAEDEWIPPTAISDMTGIKKGTIYPAVRDLAKSGLIEDDDGKYRVPTVKLEAAKRFLEDN